MIIKDETPRNGQELAEEQARPTTTEGTKERLDRLDRMGDEMGYAFAQVSDVTMALSPSDAYLLKDLAEQGNDGYWFGVLPDLDAVEEYLQQAWDGGVAEPLPFESLDEIRAALWSRLGVSRDLR